MQLTINIYLNMKGGLNLLSSSGIIKRAYSSADLRQDPVIHGIQTTSFLKNRYTGTVPVLGGRVGGSTFGSSEDYRNLKLFTKLATPLGSGTNTVVMIEIYL